MTAERHGPYEVIELPLEAILDNPHLEEAVLEALARGRSQTADRAGEVMRHSAH